MPDIQNIRQNPLIQGMAKQGLKTPIREEREERNVEQAAREKGGKKAAPAKGGKRPAGVSKVELKNVNAAEVNRANERRPATQKERLGRLINEIV